jgi:hypothetical protein
VTQTALDQRRLSRSRFRKPRAFSRRIEDAESDSVGYSTGAH